MGIVYLQVGAELDQDGRHPLRLGTVDPGQAAMPELTACGTVPAGAGAGADDKQLYELLTWDAEPEVAGLLEGAQAVVLDVRAESLRQLPWERLTRPTTSAHRDLPFLDPYRPWSRGRWETAKDVAVTLGPLRLLVVVCDPADAGLQADEELDGIHRAVEDLTGRVHLEVVDSPESWSVLGEQIEQRAPHVVHLIGHTRQMAADAAIEFGYTRDGERRTWELWAAMLRQSWPAGPRLVVLSACRTHQQQEASSGVRSLADALRAQVPAVVGMDGDIQSAAAVQFARGLYGHLAAGHTVDAAVAAGRLRIYNANSHQPDWSYPVLETGSPAGLAVPVRLGVTEEKERDLRQIGEFKKLARFVDRAEQRRRTWWAIDAEGLPTMAQEGPAVLITGPHEYGKTWLAHSSLLTWSLRGRRTQYVDLTGASRDWLDTLRALRDGMPGCELSQPLPREAFGSFTARLNWLVRQPPTVGMPSEYAAPEDDEYARFDPDAGQAAARIATIFRDFQKALERYAAEHPLVLAIDGAEEIREESWRDYVLPLLIRPLAQGLARVRLLLILPDHVLARRIQDDELPRMQRIGLGGFPKAELPRIVREYGIRNKWEDDDTKAFVGLVQQVAGSGIAPEALKQMAKTLQMLKVGFR
ncbi:hypothetical protein GCM10022251_41690 [Phytohabitans flavus]|uniref:CHAT domain-containing protein n=1 Tax=Phytohabitans flavus TaxID=1076124 RepID=UPI0031E51A98